MSTSMIDRTLSYLPVNPEFAKKDELMKYINGIFACGRAYVEINSSVLKILGDIDYSERYILRISSVADIKLSLDYKFAYISLPVGFSPFFKKLSAFHNIIAEIHTDEYSALAYLLTLKENRNLNLISMIRLTGVVSSSAESSAALLRWYKMNFHIPIDICPLNTMLSGAGDAITLYKAKADAVTLSFGRNHYYTSFEDFLINCQILSRSSMPTEIISALCTTSLAFMRIFNSIPCGMERITMKDSPVTAPVYDIEKGLVFRPFKPAHKKDIKKENIIERQIRTIGLEREIEDAIIDMLKKTNYSFYQNIIKRNFID